MYFHLTTHSAFSLQESLSTPTDLVQAAQMNGMPALALTDHNLLTGVIEFVTACKAVDIQPLLATCFIRQLFGKYRQEFCQPVR